MDGQTGSVAEAAARLSAAGITWATHEWSEQAHQRFVDPRNPIQWVHHRGLLLTFTGQPAAPADADDPAENPGGSSDNTVQTLKSRQALPQFLDDLAVLIANPDEHLMLPEHTGPNTMNVFGTLDGIRLDSHQAHWERRLLGAYRLPLSVNLLRDLRRCVEAEMTLLGLLGEPTG